MATNMEYSRNKIVNGIIAEHARSGQKINAGGCELFYLDQGQGEVVLLLHGVPSSSYLYRKIVPRLADKGLRAVAFDFPGMGLSEKPVHQDYKWSYLAEVADKFVAAMGFKDLHLVVHDIGGPVGFLLAAMNPKRIKSLTILNTMIDVASFRRPWAMHPFSVPILGEVWLSMMNHSITHLLFRMLGVKNINAVPKEEIYAYDDLLRYRNGHASFLRIMRGFELDKPTEKKCHSAVQDTPYPKQIIWGVDDPALPFDTYGKRIAELSSADRIVELPGKHFFQEEVPFDIADNIAQFINQ